MDGTWDCKDETRASIGTVVLAADTAYAFIKTDGTLGGYGNVSRIDGDYHFPKFVVTSGIFEDEMKAIGLAVHGPENDPENFNGELFLYVVVGFENKQHWDCVRRAAARMRLRPISSRPETDQQNSNSTTTDG